MREGDPGGGEGKVGSLQGAPTREGKSRFLKTIILKFKQGEDKIVFKILTFLKWLVTLFVDIAACSDEIINNLYFKYSNVSKIVL